MTLASLWSLLKGYVIIRVTGRSVEDFINEAYASGVELWNLVRIDERSIISHVYLRDLREIGRLLKRTDCTGRIERKMGLPFLTMKLAKRKGFAIGVVLFSVTLYMLSSFVWFVHVTGCDKIKPDAILEFAANQGAKPGVLRREIDSDLLARGVLAEFPGLAWVGVSIKGTTVNIEVAEKTLPEVVPGIVHLVASEDALVTNMIVLSGEPLVSEGETVSRGQILVTGVVVSPYGYEGTDVNKSYVVNAKGVIMGRVWRTYRGLLQLTQELQYETGRKAKAWRLSLGPYDFRVGPETAPFGTHVEEKSEYEIPSLRRGGAVPLVRLGVTTYRETEKFVLMTDKEKALEKLKAEASSSIKARIPRDARILDEREDLEFSEEKEWVYTLVVETIEDIAEERREDREIGH